VLYIGHDVSYILNHPLQTQKCNLHSISSSQPQPKFIYLPSFALSSSWVLVISGPPILALPLLELLKAIEVPIKKKKLCRGGLLPSTRWLGNFEPHNGCELTKDTQNASSFCKLVNTDIEPHNWPTLVETQNNLCRIKKPWEQGHLCPGWTRGWSPRSRACPNHLLSRPLSLGICEEGLCNRGPLTYVLWEMVRGPTIWAHLIGGGPFGNQKASVSKLLWGKRDGWHNTPTSPNNYVLKKWPWHQTTWSHCF
jgi:hypothetical protein